MLDAFGRNIDYIRISLTPRCQQKCLYCARENCGKPGEKREMTAEDIVFAASVFASLGFTKVRLTGGEPLLRKDITDIVEGISGLGLYKDIALTTNGAALNGLALPLKRAGLSRVNVSLDSTDGETYGRVTGARLAPVLEGIENAARIFGGIKLNAVLIRGVNDDADGLIDLARRHPVTVRFIELMPMGGAGQGVRAGELLARYPFLTPADKEDIHSPERLYSAPGFAGKVGFISPVSSSFCENCNRMRLTWDGKLRPCLGVDREYDVRTLIEARDEKSLREAISRAVAEKPEKNEFGNDFHSVRPMTEIGG